MKILQKIKPGPWSLRQTEEVWEWMQDVSRRLDNFKLTPPLRGTEERIWLDIDQLTAQQQVTTPYILAQITGVTRNTTSQITPGGFPQLQNTGVGMGSFFGGGPGTGAGGNAAGPNMLMEGGQGVGLIGQSSYPSTTPPMVSYSWIEVAPGPQGGVVPTGFGKGSGIFLIANGVATQGSNVVNITSGINLTNLSTSTSGLVARQFFLPNQAYPQGDSIASITVQNGQVQIKTSQMSQMSGTFEFDFLGVGPAYEQNGFVVPIGEVVRLWTGYSDPALGQTYLFDGDDRALAAQVTGGSQPYAWTEATFSGGVWSLVGKNPNKGTTTFQPAYERNGSVSVSAGTNVLLWRSGQPDPSTGQAYVFDNNKGGGGGQGNDWNYWRVANEPNHFGWYPAGLQAIEPGNSNGLTFVFNHIVCWPYIEVRGGTVDNIGVYVTVLPTTGTDKIRLAIYDTDATGSLKPKNLIVDTGDYGIKDAGSGGATGLVTLSASASLNAGSLYWIAGQGDYGASSGHANISANPSVWNILGNDIRFTPPNFGTAWKTSGTFAYGAFPAIFPSAIPYDYGQATGDLAPNLYLHYSA